VVVNKLKYALEFVKMKEMKENKPKSNKVNKQNKAKTSKQTQHKTKTAFHPLKEKDSQNQMGI
jgi:hypothetical protein